VPSCTWLNARSVVLTVELLVLLLYSLCCDEVIIIEHTEWNVNKQYILVSTRAISTLCPVQCAALQISTLVCSVPSLKGSDDEDDDGQSRGEREGSDGWRQ